MITGFNSLVNEKTSVLIIGSMPSVASLDANEYYAHKQNLFWRFVFECFQEDYTNANYDKKKSLLLEHGFGLWDVAHICSRQGSLDINIRDVVANDFEALFLLYPNIKRLLFNGQKAFQLFKRFHKNLLDRYEFVVLPSTSPANASIPLIKRKQLWFYELQK